MAALEAVVVERARAAAVVRAAVAAPVAVAMVMAAVAMVMAAVAAPVAVAMVRAEAVAPSAVASSANEGRAATWARAGGVLAHVSIIPKGGLIRETAEHSCAPVENHRTYYISCVGWKHGAVHFANCNTGVRQNDETRRAAAGRNNKKLRIRTRLNGRVDEGEHPSSSSRGHSGSCAHVVRRLIHIGALVRQRKRPHLRRFALAGTRQVDRHDACARMAGGRGGVKHGTKQ